MIHDIHAIESQVRSYSRTWPAVFTRAQGSYLEDATGRTYLDFFCGAGVLNYGHNPAALVQAAVGYLQSGGIIHGLDMMTAAKDAFLEALSSVVRSNLAADYRVQFTGPTGTNSVEAALKLARKVTGRRSVVAFTRAFHGVSLGALSATASGLARGAAGVPLDGVLRLPFDGYCPDADLGIDLLRRFLADPGSGHDIPAAIIVETVQGEGGVNVARTAWLSELRSIADEYGILLIADDIQVGCGRTGDFFSFTGQTWEPDLICLSKSLSGLGLPLAVLLLRAQYDVWQPAEHNGTFRGNNLAFVTAATAISEYWGNGLLPEETRRKSSRVFNALKQIATEHPATVSEIRGRGLILGIETPDPAIAGRVSRRAFEAGMLIETCGPRGEVLKLLPPLTISDAELDSGLDLLATSIAAEAHIQPTAHA